MADARNAENATAMQEPSLKELCDALRAIVDAAMHHRRESDANRSPIGRVKATPFGWPDPKTITPREFSFLSAADLIATSDTIMDQIAWVDRPVDRALKRGAREIGAIVHMRFGQDALEEVADDVCYTESRDGGRRMSFLSSALDGVGGWMS